MPFPGRPRLFLSQSAARCPYRPQAKQCRQLWPLLCSLQFKQPPCWPPCRFARQGLRPSLLSTSHREFRSDLISRISTSTCSPSLGLECIPAPPSLVSPLLPPRLAMLTFGLRGCGSVAPSCDRLPVSLVGCKLVHLLH